jgi:5-methyltetrahydrofolate--homocysteine methyltransferase
MPARGVKLPIMLSVTVSDLAGRTLSGQTLEAFLGSVSEYDIFSVGLNCSFGATQMKPYLKQLAQKSPYFLSAYPNAGLPNSMGRYDETAESMSPQIASLWTRGWSTSSADAVAPRGVIYSYYTCCRRARSRMCSSPRLPPVAVGTRTARRDPEINFVNGASAQQRGRLEEFTSATHQEQNYESPVYRPQAGGGWALVLDVNMDDGLSTRARK